jgi:hypothetical protein
MFKLIRFKWRLANLERTYIRDSIAARTWFGKPLSTVKPSQYLGY